MKLDEYEEMCAELFTLAVKNGVPLTDIIRTNISLIVSTCAMCDLPRDVLNTVVRTFMDLEESPMLDQVFSLSSNVVNRFIPDET